MANYAMKRDGFKTLVRCRFIFIAIDDMLISKQERGFIKADPTWVW